MLSGAIESLQAQLYKIKIVICRGILKQAAK